MPNDYKMAPKYEFTAMEEQAMRKSARRARQEADPDFVARTAQQVVNAPVQAMEKAKRPQPYDE